MHFFVGLPLLHLRYVAQPAGLSKPGHVKSPPDPASGDIVSLRALQCTCRGADAQEADLPPLVWTMQCKSKMCH